MAIKKVLIAELADKMRITLKVIKKSHDSRMAEKGGITLKGGERENNFEGWRKGE